MKKLLVVSGMLALATAMRLAAAEGVMSPTASEAMKSSNTLPWSTSELWTDGYVPASGDDVTLTNVMTVTLHLRLPEASTAFGKVTGWPGVILEAYKNGVNYTVADPDEFEGSWWAYHQNTFTLLPTAIHSPRLSRLNSAGGPRVAVADYAAAVSNLFGTGFIRKTGGGALAVQDPTGDVTLFVDGGALSLEPGARGDPSTLAAVLAKAYCHYDATDASSLVTNAAGRVTTWKTQTGSRNATAISGIPGPCRVEGYSNGNAILDFGPYLKDMTASSPSDAGSAALTFSRSAYVTACFMAVADRDPSGGRNGLFGDPYEVRWDRLSNGGIMNDNHHASSSDGELRVNGRRVPSTFQLDGTDLKVVALRSGADRYKNMTPTGYAPMGHIAKCKNQVGGLRVGEMIVFDCALSDVEFRTVQDYLMRKWLPADLADKGDLDGLVLAAGSNAVDVPSGTFSVRSLSVADSTLVKTGGGTLAVGAVETTGGSLQIDVRDGGIAFSGRTSPPDEPVPAADPLHWFDASAGSFTFSDGLAFTHWADVRGGDHAAMVAKEKFTTGATEFPCRLPTVVSNALNGLPTVDFGSRVSGSGRTASTASTLFADSSGTSLADLSAVSNVREGFYVALKKADKVFMLGSTDSYHFHHGDSKLLSVNNAHVGLLGAKWTVDGVPVDPSQYVVTNNTYHIYRFSATAKVNFSTFAWDRSTPYDFGGVCMAEAIFYDRELSAAERVETEAYLMRKWLGRSHPMSSQPAVFVTSAPSVAATGGEVAVSGAAAVMARAAFHVDTDDAHSLTLLTNETVGAYVAEWRDVRTNGMYATAFADSARKPTLVPGGQNGRDIVDFGIRTKYADRNGADDEDRGRAMVWSRQLELREGFIVYADHPRDTSGWMHLLGGSDSYDFHRNDKTGAFWNSTYAKEGLRNGYMAVDAETLSGSGTDYALTDRQFHVVVFAITNAALASARADAFCLDRNIYIGGQQIGEEVLFTNSLTQTERDLVRDHLMRKWKAASIRSYVYGSLAAATGAALSMPGPEVSVGILSGAVSVNGDMSLVAPAVIEVDYAADGTCPAVSAAGKVTLPASGTVRVSIADGAPHSAAPAPILTAAEGIEGNLDGWTVQVEGSAARRYSVNVCKVGKALVLRVSSPGFAVIFR